jgi:hypothetical protein
MRCARLGALVFATTLFLAACGSSDHPLEAEPGDGGSDSSSASSGPDAHDASTTHADVASDVAPDTSSDAVEASNEAARGEDARADVSREEASLEASVSDNPPIPVGYKLMLQSEVTPEITSWAVQILNDPADYPMFATAMKTFDELVVLLRVEWHPPDFQNPTVHRGVTLYEPI